MSPTAALDPAQLSVATRTPARTRVPAPTLAPTALPTATAAPVAAGDPGVSAAQADALLAQGVYRERIFDDKAAALDTYDAVLLIDPNHIEAHYFRAALLLEIGRSAEADAEFRANLARDTDEARRTYHTGRFLAQRGQLAQAIEALDKAIKLRPTYVHAYQTRAVYHWQLNDIAAAEADFDQALALDPNFIPARFYRLTMLATVSNDADAIAAFGEVIQLEPLASAPYFNRGQRYVQQRRYQEAIADFDNAVLLLPTNYQALCARGGAKAALGDNEAGLADVNAALAIEPNYLCAYRHRGWIYARMGEDALAIADYTHFLKFFTDPWVYVERGRSYFFTDDFELARKDWETAFTIYDEAGQVERAAEVQDLINRLPPPMRRL